VNDYISTFETKMVFFIINQRDHNCSEYSKNLSLTHYKLLFNIMILRLVKSLLIL